MLHTLEKHDKDHNDSLVRLIEMKVDAFNLESGYRLQFWRDVKLYGVDEALSYVADLAPPVQLKEFEEFWKKKKEELSK